MEVVEGFTSMDIDEMERVRKELGLGMDMEDLLYCRDYFKEEDRNPNSSRVKDHRHLLVRPLQTQNLCHRNN